MFQMFSAHQTQFKEWFGASYKEVAQYSPHSKLNFGTPDDYGIVSGAWR
jgi:hypothetical protein